MIPGGQPAFLAADRTGRYLLSSYYQGGHAGVFPLGEDGSLGEAPTAWVDTAIGAHSMLTDRTNPVRIRATHRPHQRQRAGTAAE